MRVAVHVTHEALYKVGGIGKVIEHLCTAQSYLSFFDKTLIYGPIFEYLESPSGRLGADGIVLFSSRDNYDCGNFAQLFGPILYKYKIDLVYGKRRIVNEPEPKNASVVDVLLVDVANMRKDLIDFFKYLFWERFKLSSDKYEHDWDYEQYFRIAIPYYELVNLLYPRAKEFVHFSHEYMGIPCLLSLELHPEFTPKHKRIFYAHEVAPVRRIVENLGGADISFYNIMRRSQRSLEEFFGSQEDWYRTPLVKLAQRFDKIFAVGDWVAEEYRFLCPYVEKQKIAIVYNAVHSRHFTFEDKIKSREKIERFLKRFVDSSISEIDVIFTHVSRLVKSKGIWRDFVLLSYLDKLFETNNLSGVYILLSSLIATGRPAYEVERISKQYNWPFEHREGFPDLVGDEIEVYKLVKSFNRSSKNIKAVFINQFGFSKARCPLLDDDVQTLDLKIASDAELCMSIYEPFGISHIEVLPSGGISILSTSCGVFFFLSSLFRDFKPYFALDFISLGNMIDLTSLKFLSAEKRSALEELCIAENSYKIFEKIPKTLKEREIYFNKMSEYVEKLSWESNIKNYFIPQVRSILE